jgi:hypothetical protein
MAALAIIASHRIATGERETKARQAAHRRGARLTGKASNLPGQRNLSGTEDRGVMHRFSTPSSGWRGAIGMALFVFA